MIIILAFFVELDDVCVYHCAVYLSMTQFRADFNDAFGFVIVSRCIIVSQGVKVYLIKSWIVQLGCKSFPLLVKCPAYRVRVILSEYVFVCLRECHESVV